MLNTGVLFHNLTLIRRCGRGAYGEVWLCRDITGKILALKLIPKTRQDIELKSVAALRQTLPEHPNVLSIHHVAMDEDFLWYTMDAADNLSAEDSYIPDTLENRIRQHRQLDITGIMRELIAGLAALHAVGMVHRDIKPANILFIHGRAVLGDIGMVTADTSSMSLAGTLGFIPPELRDGTSSPGTVGKAGDVYALGMVLYCMITGNAPEEFPTLPTNLPHTPQIRRLNRLACRACERNVDARLTGLDAFSRELDNIICREQTPITLRERLVAHKRIPRNMIAGLFLLFAIAGSVYCFFHIWELVRKDSYAQFAIKDIFKSSVVRKTDLTYRINDDYRSVKKKFLHCMELPAMQKLSQAIRQRLDFRLSRVATPEERKRLATLPLPRFSVKDSQTRFSSPDQEEFGDFETVKGISGIAFPVPKLLQRKTWKDMDLLLFPDDDPAFRDSIMISRVGNFTEAFGTDFLMSRQRLMIKPSKPERLAKPDDPVSLSEDAINECLLPIWSCSDKGYQLGEKVAFCNLRGRFNPGSPFSYSLGIKKFQILYVEYSPYSGIWQQDWFLFLEDEPSGEAVWISLLCRSERIEKREYLPEYMVRRILRERTTSL